MSRFSRPLVMLLGAAALACADRELPQAPDALDGPVRGVNPAPTAAARAQAANMEALARQTALALGRPDFRSSLRRSLDASPVREHKLHFQRYLAAPASGAMRGLAEASGVPESSIQALARATTPLEFYLPVAAHRARWDGGPDVLVATALRDGDVPVAFDIHGHRTLLDPLRPPETPVIALVPVETNFDAGPARATCTLETCDGDGTGSGSGTGGGGGGTKPPGSSPTPGLYMNSAHFVQTFEGWLRGDPEFEIHILGQSGDTDSLRTWQCAGEKASGPYTYDQNGLDWTGSVLLFTQGQIDTYQAAHPGKSLRVFAVEDDDTPCEIRVEPDEFTELIGSLPGVIRDLSGGTSSDQGLQRVWKAAPAILRLIRALASFLHSDDDLIGNAIEDIVAGEYHPGANWIVKGQDSVTNGWLTLTMH